MHSDASPSVCGLPHLPKLMGGAQANLLTSQDISPSILATKLDSFGDTIGDTFTESFGDVLGDTNPGDYQDLLGGLDTAYNPNAPGPSQYDTGEVPLSLSRHENEGTPKALSNACAVGFNIVVVCGIVENKMSMDKMLSWPL